MQDDTQLELLEGYDFPLALFDLPADRTVHNTAHGLRDDSSAPDHLRFAPPGLGAPSCTTLEASRVPRRPLGLFRHPSTALDVLSGLVGPLGGSSTGYGYPAPELARPRVVRGDSRPRRQAHTDPGPLFPRASNTGVTTPTPTNRRPAS